jgi:hypothetical protein
MNSTGKRIRTGCFAFLPQLPSLPISLARTPFRQLADQNAKNTRFSRGF